MKDDPQLPSPRWGVPEVSHVTGLKESTIRYLISRNEGPPSYKLGRARRFDPEAVMAWIEEQKQGAK